MTQRQITFAAVGGVIGFIINALGIMWYNYIWFQANISAWQYGGIALLSIVLNLLFNKLLQPIAGVILVVGIILQVLNWIGLVAFPIFH